MPGAVLVSGEATPPPADHGERLRALMGHFPTGVTVVTTHLDGADHGMTANSITSVSLEPPLVAVAMQHGSRTARAVALSGGFAVTFLAHHQHELARRFAIPDLDHFEGTTMRRTSLGHAYLPEGIGVLECTVQRAIEAGDHTLFLGEVVSSTLIGGEPLVFFRSKLGSLPPGDQALARVPPRRGQT